VCIFTLSFARVISIPPIKLRTEEIRYIILMRGPAFLIFSTTLLAISTNFPASEDDIHEKCNLSGSMPI